MTGRFRTLAGTAILGLLVLLLAVSPLVAKDSPGGRWLKIRVYENGSATPSVLVNVPMSVVSALLRVAAKTEAHASIDVRGEGGGRRRARLEDLDLQEVMKELESMDPGQIVEVQQDDKRVSIWIE